MDGKCHPDPAVEEFVSNTNRVVFEVGSGLEYCVLPSLKKEQHLYMLLTSDQQSGWIVKEPEALARTEALKTQGTG